MDKIIYYVTIQFHDWWVVAAVEEIAEVISFVRRYALFKLKHSNSSKIYTIKYKVTVTMYVCVCVFMCLCVWCVHLYDAF